MYLGKREVNRDNKDLDQTELEERDRYQVIDAVWPGILEETLFLRVQKLIDHNRSRLRSNISKTYPYTLSGIVRCEFCNELYAGMSANGRGGKYFYYSHKASCAKGGLHRIDAPSLEKFVLDRLKKIADDRELLTLLVDASNKHNIGQIGQTEALLKSKRAELSDVEKTANALVEKLVSLPKELVDSSFIQRKFQELEQRKTQLEADIGGLSDTKAKTHDAIVVLDEIKKTLQKVLRKFRTLSVPLQRELIRQVIKEVVLTPTQIKLVIYGKGTIEEQDYSEDRRLLTTGSYVGVDGSPYWANLEPVYKSLPRQPTANDASPAGRPPRPRRLRLRRLGPSIPSSLAPDIGF